MNRSYGWLQEAAPGTRVQGFAARKGPFDPAQPRSEMGVEQEFHDSADRGEPVGRDSHGAGCGPAAHIVAAVLGDNDRRIGSVQAARHAPFACSQWHGL
jgi:hypothetical protein